VPPGGAIRLTGINIGYRIDPDKEWRPVAISMLSQLRVWARVGLSIQPRVTIAKTMVWSKAWFLALFVPPPPRLLAMLRRATTLFVWTGRGPAGLTSTAAPSDIRLPSAPAMSTLSRRHTGGGVA
jgi:hypothetical protein